MELVLLVLGVGGGAAWAVRRLGARRAEARDREEELAGVRALAEEDVVVFGEQLRRLDAETAGRQLDQQGRDDYQVALDAYESAHRAVPRLTDAAQVGTVTDTLATGRYAVACLRAGMRGETRPERRVPCFFNPQHGPSVRDVEWTRPGRGTRRVPVCAQDAARVEAHERPDLRTVTIGSRRVPYWEAGDAFLPYGQGYFAAGAGAGATLGWAFSAAMPGDVAHGGAHQGGISDSGGWSGFDLGDAGGGDIGA